MGGHALKLAKTRRITREEFEESSNYLLETLNMTFVKTAIPRYFESKETFGDIDIIVSLEGYSGNLRKYIEDTFEPTEIFHNGNAYSFDYKEAQIDLITVEGKDFDSNFHYLAFNDLGNFIGRMAQVMGLKYGQEGLWYNHYTNGNQKDKIIISKDYPKIFKYMDLDYDKWIDGFDSLEEIFEYVKTSRFFNPEIFQMYHLNKINRERNAKRASYTAFLEYIEGDKPNENHALLDVVFHKEHLINIIEEAFPEANITLEVKRIEYEAAKANYAGAKFNGGIIMKEYNLKGKELGDSIKKFKEHVNEINFDGLSYEDFIIRHNPKTLRNIFETANDI